MRKTYWRPIGRFTGIPSGLPGLLIRQNADRIALYFAAAYFQYGAINVFSGNTTGDLSIASLSIGTLGTAIVEHDTNGCIMRLADYGNELLSDLYITCTDGAFTVDVSELVLPIN